MSEATLTMLKAVFLLLLYLFLFRAVRAVYLEISPARSRSHANADGGRAVSRRTPGQIVVRESGAAYPLDGEVVIGRGAGCTVSLDDTFVSQSHARLLLREDGWHVEDLGSTNGTFLNGDRLTLPRPVRKGDRVQVGRTVLELRG